MNKERILCNTDIEEIIMAVPEGHKHLRTTLKLRSGETITLQEATITNLVRAYVTLKTHPQKESVHLVGRELGDEERKVGFAGWQLVEK